MSLVVILPGSRESSEPQQRVTRRMRSSGRQGSAHSPLTLTASMQAAPTSLAMSGLQAAPRLQPKSYQASSLLEDDSSLASSSALATESEPPSS